MSVAPAILRGIAFVMRSVFSKSFGAGKLTISEKEIVEIVGRYLKGKRPGSAILEALPQGVRHERD